MIGRELKNLILNLKQPVIYFGVAPLLVCFPGIVAPAVDLVPAPLKV